MNSSRIYVERFAQACEFARQEDWEAALAAYQHVFDPLPSEGATDESPPGIADSDLVGIVEMYKANCLRRLGRLTEAQETLSAPLVQGIAPRFSKPGYLYEYCVIYGLVLGELGKVRQMGNMFLKAIQLSANGLRDAQKVSMCWSKLFAYTVQHEDWRYLLEAAEQARQFGENYEVENLVYWAEEQTAYAQRGLGNRKEAKKTARLILKRYRRARHREKIKEWKAFIATLKG